MLSAQSSSEILLFIGQRYVMEGVKLGSQLDWKIPETWSIKSRSSRFHEQDPH
jgi:hypothetical protein